MILKCKMCGGDLMVEAGTAVCECEYCGTMQTIPGADSEKKANLFNRANRLRMGAEFDKAAAVYESVAAEFPEEAEAYWGLCLCAYGIEYVDDPATGRKIPTCHRTRRTGIMDDPNFDMACEYADSVARKIYREEAKEIDRLQQEILRIAQQEAPYDVFICYKETGEDGGRTQDSVLAQDIYDALTMKGLKVFFARITLEDKLGQQYEPYIYAALHSARVMLAVGTSFEHYDAVWVKNEWSRFLAMMKEDRQKALIPCYRDLDAYDIPKEFRNLQAQDMGKLGWLQDLTRGVMKLCGKDEAPAAPAAAPAPAQPAAPSAIQNLMNSAQLHLEDGKYMLARLDYTKVLGIDVLYGPAYLGILCAHLEARSFGELPVKAQDYSEDQYYLKALRFANEDTKIRLQQWIQQCKAAMEQKRIEEEEQKRAEAERRRVEEEARKKEEEEKAKVVEQRRPHLIRLNDRFRKAARHLDRGSHGLYSYLIGITAEGTVLSVNFRSDSPSRLIGWLQECTDIYAPVGLLNSSKTMVLHNGRIRTDESNLRPVFDHVQNCASMRYCTGNGRVSVLNLQHSGALELITGRCGSGSVKKEILWTDVREAEILLSSDGNIIAVVAVKQDGSVVSRGCVFPALENVMCICSKINADYQMFPDLYVLGSDGCVTVYRCPKTDCEPVYEKHSVRYNGCDAIGIRLDRFNSIVLTEKGGVYSIERRTEKIASFPGAVTAIRWEGKTFALFADGTVKSDSELKSIAAWKLFDNVETSASEYKAARRKTLTRELETLGGQYEQLKQEQASLSFLQMKRKKEIEKQLEALALQMNEKKAALSLL